MYVIMRFAKRKGGQISSMESHNERKKDQYKSNPDIDLNRIKDNYHIIKPTCTYHREIKKRISDDGCRVRKDSVKMVEVLFTASPEFFKSTPKNEHIEYFEKAVQFIIDKVGEKNVFAATVHMDEATPHMHICFTPITRDGRLSAKEIIGNMKKLSQWQDKIHACMVERWDFFQRGTSAIETNRKHKAPWFYKQATNLDKQRIEVQEAIQNIGGLNTPKKREAAIKILNKWFTNEEKHSVELNRINKDIDTLKNELGNTQDTVTRQSTKIIELLADNNAVSQTARKQERLLRKIPQKELQLREKDIMDIINGLNER